MVNFEVRVCAADAPAVSATRITVVRMTPAITLLIGCILPPSFPKL